MRHRATMCLWSFSIALFHFSATFVLCLLQVLWRWVFPYIKRCWVHRWLNWFITEQKHDSCLDRCSSWRTFILERNVKKIIFKGRNLKTQISCQVKTTYTGIEQIQQLLLFFHSLQWNKNNGSTMLFPRVIYARILADSLRISLFAAVCLVNANCVSPELWGQRWARQNKWTSLEGKSGPPGTKAQRQWFVDDPPFATNWTL